VHSGYYSIEVYIFHRMQYPYEIQYVGMNSDNRYFKVSLFYVSLTELSSGEIEDTTTVFTIRKKIDRCKDKCLVGI